MDTTMVDQYGEVKDRFASLFQSYEASLNGRKQQRLHNIKRKALEQLKLTAFPDRKDENWKYTAVSPILKPSYQYPEVQAHSSVPRELENPIGLEEKITLLFVNGHYVKTGVKTEKGLNIFSLAQAFEHPEYRSYLENRLVQLIDHPVNAFELMNIALGINGIFINVEKNFISKTPIEVLYISNFGKDACFFHPQIIVKAEQGSHLRMIERFESKGDSMKYLSNSFHIFDIEENARLDYVKIQRECDQAFHIHQIHTQQAANSRYHSYISDIGANTVRNTHATYLKGENTETHLLGNYISSGSQSIDNQTFIDHAVPNCYSNELYKGIAAERGRGIFNGKILVHQDAQKTNAFQQNASLVLSPYAVIDAKPQLEIFADDVKCSHGATIGQLDEEAVFYLRSRGLNENEARRMLQKAFVDEVVDHIEFEEIHGFAHRIISDKLASISS